MVSTRVSSVRLGAVAKAQDNFQRESRYLAECSKFKCLLFQTHQKFGAYRTSDFSQTTPPANWALQSTHKHGVLTDNIWTIIGWSINIKRFLLPQYAQSRELIHCACDLDYAIIPDVEQPERHSYFSWRLQVVDRAAHGCSPVLRSLFVRNALTYKSLHDKQRLLVHDALAKCPSILIAAWEYLTARTMSRTYWKGQEARSVHTQMLPSLWVELRGIFPETFRVSLCSVDGNDNSFPFVDKHLLCSISTTAAWKPRVFVCPS